MASNRNILITALLLLGIIVFFGVSDVDVRVQNLFYNVQTHDWMVDRNDPLLALVFYDGIKKVLIAFGVVILLVLVFGYRHPLVRHNRRGLSILLISIIVVPAIVNGLKAATNMPCPKNLEIYGGEYPHTCVWEKYPQSFCNSKKIKCWPAGHASGGFALLALYFVFRSRKAKMVSIATALALGWTMGIYKMMIGDHFLSHTVISMVMGWLIVLLVARVVYGVGNRSGVQTAAYSKIE
ncbi:MAG: phosphatase PAP2 family protein [Sulfuricurvum sp.]